ncbi:hypothetical protein [Botrimarina sp.]|uniref:hypothetical protein n=1 Tax=Botrimarina sp. TaxID=2795802 RepID=UPI0032EF7D2C
MEREELMKLILAGPIRITMNDGQSYDVINRDFATVSDFSVSVLYKAPDGKWRHHHLPLVSIAGVEELQPQS